MKNCTLFLALSATTLFLSTQNVSATSIDFNPQYVKTTGSCGEDCTYTLTPIMDENGNPVLVTFKGNNTSTYEINNGQPTQSYRLTISGTGSAGSYGSYDNRYNQWRVAQELITDIVVEEGITSVTGFNQLYNLTTVSLPNTLTSIEKGAFALDDKLTNINLPESLITIGDAAFQKTKLTNVTIPESVVSIGSLAFSTDYLQNMTIKGDYVEFGSAYSYNGVPGPVNSVFWGDDCNGNVYCFLSLGAVNLQNLSCSEAMKEACQKLLTDTERLLGITANLTTLSQPSSMLDPKRIYTVEEAAEVVSKKGNTNTFKIRYR